MDIRKYLIGAFAAIAALAACVEEDIPASSVTLTPSQTELTSSAETTVTLNLTANGTWTASSSNKDMVLSISPSSGSSCEGLKLEVKISENKGKNRSTIITVGSSKLNSQSVTISQVGPEGDGSAPLITVAEFLSKKDKTTEYCLEGRISGIANTSYKGFDLTDATGTIAIAFPKNFDEFVSDLEVGGVAKVQGVYNFYEDKQIPQINNGQIISYTDPVPQTEFETISVAEFIDKADVFTTYRLTGLVTRFDSQHTSFYLQDTTGEIQIYSVSAESKTQFGKELKDGKQVTLRGNYYVYEKTQTVEIQNAIIEKVEDAPEAEPVVTSKVSDVIAGKLGDIFILNNVSVVARTSKSFLVTDGTDYILVNCDAEPEVADGNVVNVKGAWGEYKGFSQLSLREVTVVSAGSKPVHPDAEDITSAFDSFTSDKVRMIKFSGLLSVSRGTTNYYNITVGGATKIGSIVSPLNPGEVEAFEGVAVNVSGYYIYTNQSTAGQEYVNIILTDIAADGNYFIANPVEIKVAASETSASFNVVSNVSWTVDGPDGVTITPANGNGNALVTVNFPANTEEKEKVYNLIVETDARVSVDSYTVSITQAAYVDFGSMYFEKVTVAPDDWSGEYLFVCENTLRAINGALDPTTAALGAKGAGIDVEIKDGRIAATEVTSAAILTVTKVSDGMFAIRTGTGKYFKEADKDAGKIKAGLQASDTPVGNSFSMRDDKSVKIFSESGDTSLLMNRGSKTETNPANMFFRFYNKSNEGSEQYYNLSLYKLVK